MQFDLFEAMTALTDALETALPAGNLPTEDSAGAPAEVVAGQSDLEAAAPGQPAEEVWLTGAEYLGQSGDRSAARELRALSDRLELEALRYVRFLDTGVSV